MMEQHKKPKRFYMGAEAPKTALRLQKLGDIIDNSITYFKELSGNRPLDEKEIKSVHSLILSAQALERQQTTEHLKLEKALESMTPEELALAEAQALKLLEPAKK